MNWSLRDIAISSIDPGWMAARNIKRIDRKKEGVRLTTTRTVIAIHPVSVAAPNALSRYIADSAINRNLSLSRLGMKQPNDRPFLNDLNW
jgi:hypothetical protein